MDFLLKKTYLFLKNGSWSFVTGCPGKRRELAPDKQAEEGVNGVAYNAVGGNPGRGTTKDGVGDAGVTSYTRQMDIHNPEHVGLSGACRSVTVEQNRLRPNSLKQ